MTLQHRQDMLVAGHYPPWVISLDPRDNVKDPQRALELTFRAGSLSDQLPTVKVLARS